MPELYSLTECSKGVVMRDLLEAWKVDAKPKAALQWAFAYDGVVQPMMHSTLPLMDMLWDTVQRELEYLVKNAKYAEWGTT